MAAIVHQTAWLVGAPPKSVVYDRYRDTPAPFVQSLCGYLHDDAKLHERLGSGWSDQWDIEIVRSANGVAGGVVARARDPRQPFYGGAFTCDGRVDDAAARAYVAEIESRIIPRRP